MRAVPSRLADLRSPEGMQRRLWVLRSAFGILALILGGALLLDFLGAFVGFLPRAIVYGWIAAKGGALAWSLRAHGRRRVPLFVLLLNPALDVVGITILVYMTGGPASPAVLLYVLEVVSVAFFENGPFAFLLGLFGTACYAGVCLAVSQRVAPAVSIIPFLELKQHPSVAEVSAYVVWLGISVVIAAFFSSHMAGLLARRERELTQEVERKRALLAGVAHESRTPLQGILGLATLLKEGTYGELPRRAAHAVAGIEGGAKRILRLSETLMDLSRVEAESGALIQEAVVPREVVRSALAQARWHAGGRKVRFRVDVPDRIRAAAGEAAKVEQILVTLLVRAVQVSPDGKVAVSARSGRGGVEFSVVDHGPPLTGAEIEQLFEPFSGQGDSGLGLHTAREIAAAMGGTVEAKSPRGGGTSVRLLLPAWGG